jgi:putative transposase
MSTFTRIYYHIVFSTKHRVRALIPEKREDLFRYVWGIIKNQKCHLYRINGVEDHIHILSDLHPTVCLADYIRTIKTATNAWIRTKRVFPGFDHWQDGYGAFTCSASDKDARIEYIKMQQEHHKTVSFADELRALLSESGVEFDEKYLL